MTDQLGPKTNTDDSKTLSAVEILAVQKELWKYCKGFLGGLVILITLFGAIAYAIINITVQHIVEKEVASSFGDATIEKILRDEELVGKIANNPRLLKLVVNQVGEFKPVIESSFSNFEDAKFTEDNGRQSKPIPHDFPFKVKHVWIANHQSPGNVDWITATIDPKNPNRVNVVGRNNGKGRAFSCYIWASSF